MNDYIYRKHGALGTLSRYLPFLLVWILYGFPSCLSDAPDTAVLKIANETDYDFTYLSLRLTSSTEWGENQLSGDPIAPNTDFYLYHIPVGTYQVSLGYAEVDSIGQVILDLCYDQPLVQLKGNEITEIVVPALEVCTEQS